MICIYNPRHLFHTQNKVASKYLPAAMWGYWYTPSKSDFPECAGSQWVLITAKACLDYCAHFAIKSHYTEAWLTALTFLSVDGDRDDMSALNGPPQGLIYKQWDCIQFLVPGYPYSKNAFDYPIRNHTLFTITLVCTHVYLKPMFFLVYIITSHPSFGNRNSGVILFVDQRQKLETNQPFIIHAQLFSLPGWLSFLVYHQI